MKKFFIYLSATLMVFVISGCADFFEQESDHIIYADDRTINQESDQIYGVTGIMNKLQAIADRTIILGEARGDLVNVTTTASSDLRDVAEFNVGDDNMYNSPRDYYAIINNCNFYIAKADTSLRDNRNEYIFMAEYAAVKAIRAWTYLQLALNYGTVPFVTEPILTKEASEQAYPKATIRAICEYFINDLLPLAERYGREYPNYGDIRNTNSNFFYFPINIVLGDMYLWMASLTGDKEQYKNAALRYYKYISERNGDNSTYPTSAGRLVWPIGTTSWSSPSEYDNLTRNFYTETYNNNSELITMIPGDSIRAEGNYSELRNIFNSREENDYQSSLVPSNRMIEISESQEHCMVDPETYIVTYAPKGLTEHMTGDLRLSEMWREGWTYNNSNQRVETDFIYKYQTRNVHIYRRMMVYLRMAEALNMAGYPRMAFAILSSGLTNQVLEYDVYPYYSEGDSIWISQFDFPPSRYGIMDPEYFSPKLSQQPTQIPGVINTIGIHSRGSGYTPLNEFYALPVDTLLTEEEQTPTFQKYVDELIINEDALEFAFEGIRYYDLMRWAYRQPNPGQALADRIYLRRGKENVEAVRSEIKVDLTNQDNWFLHWTGM